MHKVAERDLYKNLLDLAELTNARTFLDGTCALLRQSADAEAAFIGIFRGDQLAWSSNDGMAEQAAAAVLGHVSTGVLKHVVASGKAVRTSSALLDARFASRASVRRNAIEAVLCVPIQLEPGLTGVVYGKPVGECSPSQIFKVAPIVDTYRGSRAKDCPG